MRICKFMSIYILFSKISVKKWFKTGVSGNTGYENVRGFFSPCY